MPDDHLVVTGEDDELSELDESFSGSNSSASLPALPSVSPSDPSSVLPPALSSLEKRVRSNNVTLRESVATHFHSQYSATVVVFDPLCNLSAESVLHIQNTAAHLRKANENFQQLMTAARMISRGIDAFLITN